MSPIVVLLPVKRPELAKSRLASLGEEVRRELAVAFALDTLAAALAARCVDEVVVVTDDPTVAGRARAAGSRVAPDAGELNAALRAGAERLDPSSYVVALCADLPALQPADLDAALREMSGVEAFVGDRQRLGTTTYAAPWARFTPRFGSGSSGRHRAAGAVEVLGALPTLRLDVDDPESLGAAAELGLGEHTRSVLAAR